MIQQVSSFYYRGFLTNARFLNGYAAYSGASFALPTSNLSAISTTTALYLAQTDAAKYSDSGPLSRSTLQRSLIWSSGTPFTAAPTIASDAVVQTGAATAALTTTISDVPAGQTVAARGAVWDVSPAPTTALSTKTSDGTGAGTFTSAITGLAARQYYYVRAYATLSEGTTTYGPETLFEVVAIPTLTTVAPAGISTTTAVGGGQITAMGGAYATVRGLVWSDQTAPTTALSTQSAEIGFFSTSPAYTTVLSSLLQGVQYYIRAFATNRAGTAYGGEQTFTTLTTPTVSTAAISSVEATTAASGGTVSADGGEAVSVRGIVWGTSSGPTVALTTKTTDGSGVGSFTSALTGLTAGTLYYVRAYATNSAGTAYGAETSFTTSTEGIVVSTLTASAVASASMLLTGQVIAAPSTGGSTTVTGRYLRLLRTAMSSGGESLMNLAEIEVYDANGVKYTGLSASESSNYQGSYPASNLINGNYNDFAATNADGVGNTWMEVDLGSDKAISKFIIYNRVSCCQDRATGVTPYIRNAAGTTVYTGAVITTADMVYTYNIFNASLYATGLIWSKTTSTPTTALTTLASTVGLYSTGYFSTTISSLSEGTLYWYRAFATDPSTIAYGGTASTTTSYSPPSLSMVSASFLTSPLAMAQYSITSTGGQAPTNMGVVWDTNSTPTVALSTQSSITGSFGMGSYSTIITPLYSSSSYWIRSFATNSAGLAYSDQLLLTAAVPVAYPPISPTSFTTNNTTNCYFTISGQSYGNGAYKVISRSTYSDYNVGKLVDKNKSAAPYSWASDGTTLTSVSYPGISGYNGEWVSYELPAAIYLKSVELNSSGTSGGGYVQRPENFRIYATNNVASPTWTQIYDSAGIVWVNGTKTFTCTIASPYNSTAYTKFVFVVSKIYNSGNYVEIAEIELFGTAAA
jgi:hypothetical protein